MSEMVDRVALAIRESNEDAMGLRYTELTEAMARSAIKAMREPTDAMCQAAMIAAVTEENKGIEYAPKQGWQAMIDEVLK